MAEVPAEGAVPLVVALAVVAHPDIHAVLAICGFANVVDRTSIINNEGFHLKWLSTWIITWLWQVV
jgi:hypothetical protein